MHGVMRNVKLSIDFRKVFSSLYLAFCEWVEPRMRVSIYGHVP